MSPTENILWSNENVNGQPLEETAAWEPLEETAAGETLLSFFFPTSKFLFYFIPPNVLVLKTVVKCLGGSVVYWHWSETNLSFNPDSALCLRQDNL